jgi:hypothetical protein
MIRQGKVITHPVIPPARIGRHHGNFGSPLGWTEFTAGNTFKQYFSIGWNKVGYGPEQLGLSYS